ncbi:MFS transporter [Acetanaerobacterium elongatum]|uniref:Predicted arabinose efflux permease, MFS family n=1 Tax=Acetanaerobacterium elongatum TaxID=258515 RepID=A0A1H0AZS2_9FIRM|nr:MFS transporter [Acetanaerobacterium elongatum]SDN38869.1 Predicted arabinose efflux permease, MFS family [Acetanaerobacterium elongatum]
MKKEFSIVCISVFLLVLGTCISGTILVPYAKTLGGTGFIIGVIYSSMYAVRLIIGTPVGRLSQKRGAKTILLYSLILYIFIAAAYLISWNIPSLLAARLLHGVASAMMLPMAMAYVGEISPEGQEGRYMGIYNTILFVASGVGPIIGGVIYESRESNGNIPVFLTLLGLSFVSLFILLCFGNFKKGNHTNPKAYKQQEPVYSKLTDILKSKSMIGLACLNIVSAVLLALFGATFTQYALDNRMNMGTIGVLIAVYNVVIGAIQIPLGRFCDRHNKIKLVMISGAITALLVLFFPAFKGCWLIGILLVFLGICTALHLSSITALAAVVGKEAGMGVTMGFLGSVNSAGTIIGYLLLGIITDAAGIQNTFLFTAALFLAGNIVFLILWHLNKKIK